jgi:hypothetical protein
MHPQQPLAPRECVIMRDPLPPLFAAICWGGQLSQCLYSTPPRWAPRFTPTALLLRDWWADLLVQLKHFSDGDRAGILGSYKNWRACKTASMRSAL